MRSDEYDQRVKTELAKPIPCSTCGFAKCDIVSNTWETEIGGRFSAQKTKTTFVRVKCPKCKHGYNKALFKQEIKDKEVGKP